MGIKQNLQQQSPLSKRLMLFALAASIGAIVGLATIGLVKLILLVQYIGYGQASEMQFANIVESVPAWQAVLVPTVGGLVVGLLMQFLPEKRYHGISEVMEACALNSARMSVRSGLGAAAAAGISLGVGAPLGREGPAVHIGASISAWLAEKLDLNRRQSLALLGCGAAAAVTASFDTPIAAVIFALEVIVGYYTLRVFAPVVIAAMMAIVVRDLVLGSEPLFVLPAYQLSSLWELLLFALLGVLGAIVSCLLIIMVGAFQKMWIKFPVAEWVRPGIAGLLIGLIALELPLILSVGINAVAEAFQGSLAAQLLLSLLIFKLLAVALAIGSGFAGGVFSPAVYIGAMLGGSFWLLLNALGIPVSSQGVYAIVGTAAVASAVLGAPISTILIVFELTRNYDITLGVMTAAAFASTVMSLTGYGSYFRWVLAQRNINISSGRDISLLMTHRIEPLIVQSYSRIDQQSTVGGVESKLVSQRQRLAMIVDDDDVFYGSVTLQQVVSHGLEQGMDHPILAAAFDADYAVGASMNVVTALQKMAENQVEFLPVVRYENDKLARLLGIVTKSALLTEHYDVVKKEREEEFGIT